MLLARSTISLLVAFTCLLQLPQAVAADSRGTGQVIPVFTIRGALLETPQSEVLPFSSATGGSLKELVARMNRARDDENVPAVVVLLSDAALGTGQIEELRQALDGIQASGKPVLAHADSLSMGGYVLLSGASRVSVVPTGDLWITGISAESPYLRGLLDKIGVTPDFFTCGEYKSAAEMFMRSTPSRESRENLDWLLDGIFENYVRLIAQGRGQQAETVREWIDRGLYSAAEAQEAGLIDDVRYRQEFVAALQETYGSEIKFDGRYGKKQGVELDLSSPLGLFKFYMDLLAGSRPRRSTQDAVAIVYVDGPIVAGSGNPGSFPFATTGTAYSTPIRKALDKVAKDETVKAVVLRVNSPGGSAVASEIILDATKRVKQEKPLVVSMGDVAGSGGYYVACGAETIFADASTLTGSIGVVAGKLATTEMWGKVGIEWTSIRRGENAGILSSQETFSETQRQQLLNWMNEIYEVFKGHVTTARGDRLTKEIEELAGGRVYTGRQALELGLVDRLGGLDDAVQYAAEQAALEEGAYEVRVVPPPKDLVELLLDDLTGAGDQDPLSLGDSQHSAAGARMLLDAAAPLLKNMETEQVQAVFQAVQQLSVLHHERLLLGMPVIEIHK